MKSVRTTRSLIAMAASMCLAGTVMAQSTTGSLYGKAPPGTTVVVIGASGVTRTVKADGEGRYNILGLPAGDYKIDAQGVGTREVTVTIGGGTEASFAKSLETVVVTGTRTLAVDISQVDTRTVFTADTLSKIAVGQSINQVAMLAPGVVNSNSFNVPSSASNNNNPLGRASSANIGSFGGSAASENAFYINGFPVTNPLTNMGATSLPFNSIGQVQVLTGGYGAEYGRSTGGVVNVLTKSGTNEWKGGVYAIMSPAALKSAPVDLTYPNTGVWSQSSHYNTTAGNKPVNWTDGTLYQERRQNAASNYTYGAYVGGPIIRDKLFIFANIEQNRDQVDSIRATRVGALTPSTAAQAWKSANNTYPRGTLKLDWNITDNHRLEVTAVEDNAKEEYSYYGFDYAADAHNTVKYDGDHVLSDTSRLYVAKYTGNLTNDLTVSALVGQQKIKHKPDPLPSYDPTKNAVTISPTTVPAQYAGLSNPQPVPTIFDPSTDKTTGYRLDVTYVLGKHELRAGYDHFKADSYLFSRNSGPNAVAWVYSLMSVPTENIDNSHGIGSPASAGGLGTQGYYVRQNFASSGGAVSTEQAAYYLEDRWQVTEKVLLSLGFRNDSFTNYNGDGKPYVEQKGNKGPRIGAAWDVFGNASLKLFGNAGRYFLAMPNNVAIRGANAALNADKYYTYTGINADGTPSGLVQIAPAAGAQGTCAPGTVGAGATSTNLECGNAPDPATIAIVDLKAHYQDEFIIGMEQSLTKQWAWGAKATYRNLKSAIDDTCAGGQCRIFNPGEGGTFKIPDGKGGYTYTNLTAADIGLPKLKRRYVALDLFTEYQGPQLYGKIEYTWSRNYGNAEGQLNSTADTGAGGQADVSVTSDWDLPEIMEGANGRLPNDRKHQIKLFGSYKIDDEWRVGGSATIASGRPRSCTSFYPYAKDGIYNDNRVYHYCGVPGDQTSVNTPVATNPGYVFSPRGLAGTTPWTKTFNLSVTYTPSQLKGVTLQADVMNVFNTQTATAYYDVSASSRSTVASRYGQAFYYTDPRSVRLTGRYDF